MRVQFGLQQWLLLPFASKDARSTSSPPWLSVQIQCCPQSHFQPVHGNQVISHHPTHVLGCRNDPPPSCSSDGVWKTQLGSVALAWGLDAKMGLDAWWLVDCQCQAAKSYILPIWFITSRGSSPTRPATSLEHHLLAVVKRRGVPRSGSCYLVLWYWTPVLIAVYVVHIYMWVF